MNRHRIVVVLGMHRSGTSAVARALQVMGVELGDTLMPPHQEGNPRGYWEDVEINALNVKILHALGLDWHYLSPIEHTQIDQLRREGFLEQARQLLQRKTAGRILFGFKDPRVSKILPFWREVFAECDFDVSYVLAIRHPLSVVDSLEKRDGLPPIKSALLWLGHVLESLACVEDGSLAVVVDYDRLMQSPAHELTRMASSLHLSVDPGRLQVYSEEFIAPELRHWFHRASEFHVGDGWPPLLQDVYASLLDVATRDESVSFNDILSKLAVWRQDFGHAKAAMILNDELMVKQSSLAADLQARDLQIDAVQKQLAERDVQISNLVQAVTEYGESTRAMKLTAISRERQLVGLGKVVSDREAKVGAFQLQVDDLQNRIAELAPRLEAGAAEVEMLKKAEGELTTKVSRLQHQVLERDQRLAELQKARQELDDKARGLAVELAAQTSLTAKLTQAVGALQQRQAALTGELAEQRHEHQHLKATLAAGDELIASLKREVEALEIQHSSVLESHRVDIDRFQQLVAVRDAEIATTHRALAERDARIGNLSKAVGEYLGLIGTLNRRKQDDEKRILELSSVAADRRTELQRLGAEHAALVADMAVLRKTRWMRLGGAVQRVAGLPLLPRPGARPMPASAVGGDKQGQAVKVHADLDALLQLQDSQFIESLYRTLLRRPPDPEGFRHYRHKIESGSAPMQLIADVALSSECVSSRVILPGLGEAIALHRISRVPFIGKWFVDREFFRPSQRSCPQSRLALDIDALLCLDHAQFLERAYRLVLNRNADPEGLAFYSNKLHRGVPALVILGDMLASPEAASVGGDALAWRAQVRWRRLGSLPLIGRLLPLDIPSHLKRPALLVAPGVENGQGSIAPAGTNAVVPAVQSGAGALRSPIGNRDQKATAPRAQVLISVVMSVYKTPSALLRKTIGSVLSQSYTQWELCICNDGSEDPRLDRLLDEYVQSEPRIKLVTLDKNVGIANATNKAMELVAGEFMAFLDHDDELTVDALEQVVNALSAKPETDVLYSDQDKIDEAGRVFETFYKPDWSPDYFRRVMYVGHLLVVRSTLARNVGGLDPKFDRVQDYEFVLRLSEVTSHVLHIAKVLYHWRAIEGSIAASSDAKGGIEALQCLAVQNHLNRLGSKLLVQPHPVFAHRALILPQDVKSDIRVSIIIPSKNHPEHIGRCLHSIFERSTYKNFEVIVVDNGTTDAEALSILKSHPIVVLPYDEKFSYSRANNMGAARATGDVLVLLNNDTEVLTDNWIELLLLNLMQPDVGIVGPMLLYPDRTVQHAGIVLGPRGTADHVMRGFPASSDGYAGSLSCVREVSGITGACLMTRRETYQQAGGLSELYATHYQDVDFCLVVRAQGKRILHVPEAQLIHYESASRGSDYDFLDRLLLQDSWHDAIADGDPYFNPAFSLQRLDYSLSVD